MCSDYRIVFITGFQIKNLIPLVKLFIQNIYRNILYINIQKSVLRHVDPLPGNYHEISSYTTAVAR
jgi:hypothetical protein